MRRKSPYQGRAQTAGGHRSALSAELELWLTVKVGAILCAEIEAKRIKSVDKIVERISTPQVLRRF